MLLRGFTSIDMEVVWYWSASCMIFLQTDVDQHWVEWSSLAYSHCRACTHLDAGEYSAPVTFVECLDGAYQIFFNIERPEHIP